MSRDTDAVAVISDLMELQLLLGRVYWVETQLENSSQWEAYRVAKTQEYKDILFKISHDSQEHKRRLEKINSNLEGPDLQELSQNFKGMEYNFKLMKDEEIAREVMKNEALVLDLYKRIFAATNRDFLKDIWMGAEPEDYFRGLKWLIAQEEGHLQLLEKYSGKVQRIA
jgi:rubrerythrin